MPDLYEGPIVSATGATANPDGFGHPGAAWHHGDPLGEQRRALTGCGLVDRTDRRVLAVTGADRLTWLHSLLSQHVADLRDGEGAEALLLDANGRIEHHLILTDLAGVTYIDTEAAAGSALLDFLSRMVFRADARPAASDLVVLTLCGPTTDTVLRTAGLPVPTDPYSARAIAGGLTRRLPWPVADTIDVLVPRDQAVTTWDRLVDAGAGPLGTWGFDALRVEALRPTVGVDTDARTIPHETRWIGGAAEHGAVHLDKGCYRGQETVARVHNLGRPPRHLVLLHIDGSDDSRPAVGDEITAAGRTVGRLGTVVDHHELGTIGLGLVKRTLDPAAELLAGGVPVAVDVDSIPAYDEIQAGRRAVDRLRGRLDPAD